MDSYSPLFAQIPRDHLACWPLLRDFVRCWRPVRADHVPATDIDVAAVEQKLGISFPAALRCWHKHVGHSLYEWGSRARVFQLDELVVEDDFLILRKEMVFSGAATIPWGVRVEDLSSDDPPVYTIWSHKEPTVWVERVSKFAICAVVFDTVTADHHREFAPDNTIPFPTDGQRMEFPDSFGVIKTEIHEGNDWLALVSGSDWYLRQRDPATLEHSLVKHEVRD